MSQRGERPPCMCGTCPECEAQMPSPKPCDVLPMCPFAFVGHAPEVFRKVGTICDYSDLDPRYEVLEDPPAPNKGEETLGDILERNIGRRVEIVIRFLD